MGGLREPTRFHGGSACELCLAALAVGGGVYALERAGLTLHLPPSSGFALGAVMLWGPRAAAGVLLGSALAGAERLHLVHAAALSAMLGASALIGIANAAQALFGAALLRRFSVSNKMASTPRDAVLFCAFAPLIALISPAIGAPALAAAGFLPWEGLIGAGLGWWGAGAVGILVMAPLTLSLGRDPAPPKRPAFARAAEGACAASALALFARLAYDGRAQPQMHIMAAPLLWIIARFGPRATTAAVASLACFIAWMGADAAWRTAAPPLTHSLPPSSSQLLVLSAGALLVRALLEERGVELQLAREAAIAREARASLYREIFERAPVGLAILQAAASEGAAVPAIIALNQAALRQAGAEGRDAAAVGLSDIVDEEGVNAVSRACREALASGECRVVGDVAGSSAAGTHLRFELVKISDTQAAATVKEAVPSEQAGYPCSPQELETRSIIDNVRDYAIYRLSPEGRVLSWNKGAQVIYGYHADEIIGESFARFFTPEDRERGVPAELLEEAARKGSRSVEYWRLRKNGTRLWANLVLTAIRDASGRSMGFLAILRDATLRHELEVALEGQKAVLKKSNTELAQFAYVASHDLREPLHKVRAFTDLLKTKLQGKLDEQGEDYMRRMLRAISGMQRLIDDLLLLARVSTSGAAFEIVNLSTLAADVLEGFDIALTHPGARVDIGPLPRIQADPLQMRQLLQNLVSNALKFHKPNSRQVVAISARTTNDGWCELTVADEGIGMDMKYAERIFQPFQRLESRSEYEGTGMGLAICQRIAARHGGTIGVASELGRGSTFKVRLPLSQSERTQAVAALRGAS